MDVVRVSRAAKELDLAISRDVKTVMLPTGAWSVRGFPRAITIEEIRAVGQRADVAIHRHLHDLIDGNEDVRAAFARVVDAVIELDGRLKLADTRYPQHIITLKGSLGPMAQGRSQELSIPAVRTRMLEWAATLPPPQAQALLDSCVRVRDMATAQWLHSMGLPPRLTELAPVVYRLRRGATTASGRDVFAIDQHLLLHVRCLKQRQSNGGISGDHFRVADEASSLTFVFVFATVVPMLHVLVHSIRLERKAVTALIKGPAAARAAPAVPAAAGGFRPPQQKREPPPKPPKSPIATADVDSGCDCDEEGCRVGELLFPKLQLRSSRGPAGVLLETANGEASRMIGNALRKAFSEIAGWTFAQGARRVLMCKAYHTPGSASQQYEEWLRVRRDAGKTAGHSLATQAHYVLPRADISTAACFSPQEIPVQNAMLRFHAIQATVGRSREDAAISRRELVDKWRRAEAAAHGQVPGRPPVADPPPWQTRAAMEILPPALLPIFHPVDDLSDADVKLVLQWAVDNPQAQPLSDQLKMLRHLITRGPASSMLACHPCNFGKTSLTVLHGVACASVLKSEPGVVVVLVPLRAMVAELVALFTRRGTPFRAWAPGFVDGAEGCNEGVFMTTDASAPRVLVSTWDTATKRVESAAISLLLQSGFVRSLVVDEIDRYLADTYREKLGRIVRLTQAAHRAGVAVDLLSATLPPRLHASMLRVMLGDVDHQTRIFGVQDCQLRPTLLLERVDAAAVGRHQPRRHERRQQRLPPGDELILQLVTAYWASERRYVIVQVAACSDVPRLMDLCKAHFGEVACAHVTGLTGQMASGVLDGELDRIRTMDISLVFTTTVVSSGVSAFDHFSVVIFSHIYSLQVLVQMGERIMRRSRSNPDGIALHRHEPPAAPLRDGDDNDHHAAEQLGRIIITSAGSRAWPPGADEPPVVLPLAPNATADEVRAADLAFGKLGVDELLTTPGCLRAVLARTFSVGPKAKFASEAEVPLCCTKCTNCDVSASERLH
jgi:hypothetical protein